MLENTQKLFIRSLEEKIAQESQGFGSNIELWCKLFTCMELYEIVCSDWTWEASCFLVHYVILASICFFTF